MALKDIKAKILATKRMHTVTRAMEAVSAVKMRKTQATALAGRPYARAALSILARLSGSLSHLKHPLTTEREVKNVALVVITSDKGLAGSLNSGVLKSAQETAHRYTREQVTVYAYGKKGFDYFTRRRYAVQAHYPNKRDDVSVTDLESLTKELVSSFVSGAYDEVYAVYSNFKSTFEQSPTVRRVLPLSLEAVQTLVEDIRPVKGKWSRDVAPKAPAQYDVEPSVEHVLETVIPRLVTISLYHMLLEAKASEHSARMVAMKSASDKSKEVSRDLTRVYNKIRQAAITREVSEIVGGREALAT